MLLKDQTASAVQFVDGGFRLGDKPVFLYSGEVHYFRIPKAQWRSRLKALKGAGFNAVSTYIPWIWHEPEEGKFDFTGETHPERDIVGFMAAAEAEGLYVMARVGPVSNAELVHEGVPDWLIHDHPEIFVTGTRDVGNLAHVTIISYLHPLFQEKVGIWFDALLPLVAERQVSRGGMVFGVQLCNEVAMVHWLQKGADYKPHVEQFYRRFLEETYGGDIAKLNAAYGTSHASFDSVSQPKSEEAKAERPAPHVDWALFYRRYYATYFKTLSVRAREKGIDVPLFCNIPQFYDYDVRGRGNWAPMTTSMFRDFPLLTPGLVFGGAYQMRHLDFENFHDVALTTEVTRLLNSVHVESESAYKSPSEAGRLPSAPRYRVERTSQVPVVCAELQTGIMRDRPRLYPQQVHLNVKTSVSQGLAGVNGYMLAGGVNPPGLGAFGTYHDWQSPIGPKGEIRPHMEPLRDFGRFLKWAGPLLAGARKTVDTSLGFYLPYFSTEYWTAPWVDRLEAERTNLWYDGLARLVQLSGFSYDLADVGRTPIDVLATFPSLWLYTQDFMDKDTQLKLAEYVRRGGKLVLYPRLPSRDLSGKPETALADGLGVSISGQKPGNLFTHAGKDHWIQGPIQLYKAEGAHEALVALEGGAAVLRKSVGQGEALLVGFGMPHTFDHFRDWVRGWGEGLGLKTQVVCEPWDMQATLREAGDYGFLFLFNYHFTPRTAKVSCTLSGTGEKFSFPAKGTIAMEPFSAVILPVNVPLGHDVRLVSATAEAVDAKAGPKDVKVVFDTRAGGNVEAVVATPRKPKSVSVDGKKRPFQYKKGRASFAFPAVAKESKVAIVF